MSPRRKTYEEGRNAAQSASLDWIRGVVDFAREVQREMGEILGTEGRASELLRLLREGKPDGEEDPEWP